MRSIVAVSSLWGCRDIRLPGLIYPARCWFLVTIVAARILMRLAYTIGSDFMFLN